MFGHGEDGGGGRCGGDGPGASGVGDPLPTQAGRRAGPLVPPIRRQQPWAHPPTALPHRAAAASCAVNEAVVVKACKWSISVFNTEDSQRIVAKITLSLTVLMVG